MTPVSPMMDWADPGHPVGNTTVVAAGDLTVVAMDSCMELQRLPAAAFRRGHKRLRGGRHKREWAWQLRRQG
jgi:hypothetical protein